VCQTRGEHAAKRCRLCCYLAYKSRRSCKARAWGDWRRAGCRRMQAPGAPIEHSVLHGGTHSPGGHRRRKRLSRPRAPRPGRPQARAPRRAARARGSGCAAAGQTRPRTRPGMPAPVQLPVHLRCMRTGHVCIAFRTGSRAGLHVPSGRLPSGGSAGRLAPDARARWAPPPPSGSPARPVRRSSIRLETC